MTNSFSDGFKFFCSNSSDLLSATIQNLTSGNYLRTLDSAIRDFTAAMNSYEGNMNPQLKGLIAETWHAKTFNIDAVSKQSGYSAKQVGSNGLGSVDVSTNFGEDYSLKYCKDGATSALSQGHTLEWAYNRYLANLPEGTPRPTVQEYLSQCGLDPNTDIKLSLYQGQARLIPTDQLKDAIEALDKRIARNEHNLANPSRNLENISLKDVRQKLVDHIEGPDGSKSMPLTEAESRELANCARNGKFEPERYNITIAKKADMALLCRNTLNAGLSAAAVSAMTKAAPEIIKIIDKAIKTGELDRELLLTGGKKAVEGGAEGFIRGASCAIFLNMSQLGYLGEELQRYALQANSSLPSITAIVVTLLVETVKDSILLYRGDIDKVEFARNIEKRIIIAAFAYGGGVALQGIMPQFPVIGYMLGSLLGALIGGLVFNIKEMLMMSLCVEHGFTFFGLVDQNYQLPIESLRQIGIDIFEYDSSTFQKYNTNNYGFDNYVGDASNYYKWDFVMVKRGVIGIRRVGYQLLH